MAPKPRPIEISISVHDLQNCYRDGFKAAGDMMLHILRAAGFRFQPGAPGKPPEMCPPWQRVDSPGGFHMTFRQWPKPPDPWDQTSSGRGRDKD